MSTPVTRKGRRKLGLLASLFVAFGVFLAVGVGSAAAGTVSCVYDGAIGLVTVTISDNNAAGAAADNTITIRRSGEAIVVNGLTCNDPATGFAATVANTDQVNILPGPLGADGNDALVIDQRGGLFIPGFSTGESPTTLNEIEFFADLGFERNTTTGNTVTVYGTEAADGITAGNDGVGTNWDGVAPAGEPVAPRLDDYLVNLNAGLLTDDDADLWVLDNGGGIGGGGLLTSAKYFLGGGDDVFLGKGGDGTGGPTSLPQTIDAGAGDDFIIGGIGSDTIIVGPGNDVVDGNLPVTADVICLQDDVQAEWYVDSSTGDTLDLSALPGPATITLNPDGSVVITGVTVVATGIESVIGTAGNDTITGNAFGNNLGGGGGNDTIHGGLGDDAVVGGAGDDTLFGDENDDCVIGNDGNDTLNENTGVSGTTAQSTATGDTLNTNGSDALDGGPGVDTVTYSERTTSIVVYLGLISTFNDGADLNQDGLSNEFDDVFFTTENAITGSGQDIISANFVNNRANNVFTDNAGNDCLEGGPGNDQFIQNAEPQGADVVIGNTGADLADYSARTGAVAVSLDGVANDGDIATNEGDNVGGFAVSCRPATIIVNPPFSGSPFNGSFVDDFNGFLTDAPTPGPAPTICFEDFLTPARSTQGFGVGFCQGETLGGDQSPLVNVDVENVNGGSGNDEITGDGNGNVLHGNGGNDTVSGGAASDQLWGDAGDDLLRGGAGNDTIDGGEGNNTADYASAGAGGVGVQVNLTTGLATGEGNDTLKSIQNVNGSSFDDSLKGDGSDNILNGAGGEDNIAGNAGNDTINGGGAADQMSGQTGDDKITGAQGNDAMQGGAGNDWLQGGQGRDTILGQKGNDKLYGNAQPDFLNGGPGRDVCKPGSPGLARGDVVVNCES